MKIYNADHLKRKEYLRIDLGQSFDDLEKLAFQLLDTTCRSIRCKRMTSLHKQTLEHITALLVYRGIIKGEEE